MNLDFDCLDVIRTGINRSRKVSIKTVLYQGESLAIATTFLQDIQEVVRREELLPVQGRYGRTMVVKVKPTSAVLKSKYIKGVYQHTLILKGDVI